MTVAAIEFDMRIDVVNDYTGQWFSNLGSDRDWAFVAQPNACLNGRAIPLNMGKVLGGGSSINVMACLRGHKNDCGFFAAEAGDPGWNYDAPVPTDE